MWVFVRACVSVHLCPKMLGRGWDEEKGVGNTTASEGEGVIPNPACVRVRACVSVTDRERECMWVCVCERERAREGV